MPRVDKCRKGTQAKPASFAARSPLAGNGRARFARVQTLEGCACGEGSSAGRAHICRFSTATSFTWRS
eukprot:358876-Prymnesium_polylepis.1